MPTFLYFHNLLTNDPTTNIILLLVALGGWMISTVLVVYGAYSLIRYWTYLSRPLQFAFAVSPLIVLGLSSSGPWPAAFLSLPFGGFAILPFMFVLTINFGPGPFVNFVLTFSAVMANVFGAVGLIRRVSKSFGYR